MYEKFYRRVLITRVQDQYHVFYESGDEGIDRQMSRRFDTIEEAKEAIKQLDDEIKEAL